jgi:hypothetical protein
VNMSVYTIVPFVVIAILFGASRLWQKRMIQSANAQYPNAAAGLVAQRLGLELLAGAADFNLVTWETAAPQVNTQNPLAHTIFDYHIEARGKPRGRPASLTLRLKREMGAAIPLLRRTLTTSDFCALTIEVSAPLPCFELVLLSGQTDLLRAETVHGLTRTDMQKVPNAFANPTYDAAFDLTSNDPQVAARLGRSLAVLMGLSFVHLVGEPGKLGFHFPLLGYYALSTQAELYLEALLALAEAFEAGA